MNNVTCLNSQDDFKREEEGQREGSERKRGREREEREKGVRGRERKREGERRE